MDRPVDVDKFIKNREIEITTLVNTALNRAGKIVQEKVAAGEITATIQEIMPLLLYEVLVTNTVATLRLVAEMINEENGGKNQNRQVGH